MGEAGAYARFGPRNLRNFAGYRVQVNGAKHFKNAQVSVKFSSKLDVDISTQARIKKWTDSQIKSLEFEMFGVQLEPTAGLDARGKPAVGLELTVPRRARP